MTSIDTTSDPAAPQPPRGRDWLTTMAIVVALVLAAVAAAQGRDADGAGRCSELGDVMQRLWGTRQHQAVRSAVEAAGADADRIVADFDAYAQTWTHERVELCQAREAGALQPRDAWGREQCLHARAEELAGAVSLIEDAARDDPQSIAALASVLVPPDACRLAQRYRHAHPIPSSPNRQAQVLAWRQDFARARVLLAIGEAKRARALLDELSTRAEELDHPASSLHLQAARVASWGPRLEDAPDATLQLRRLVDTAEQLGDDVIAGRALAMELVALLGDGGLDEEAYARLLGRARAKADRVGDPLTATMLDCVREHVGPDSAGVSSPPPCVRFVL